MSLNRSNQNPYAVAARQSRHHLQGHGNRQRWPLAPNLSASRGQYPECRNPSGRHDAIEEGSMNPILFALFTAGVVAFVQAVANAAEDITHLRRAARIKRRILDADRSELLWSKVKQ